MYFSLRDWATQEDYNHFPMEIIGRSFGVLLGWSDSFVSPTFLGLTFRVAVESLGRWLCSPTGPA